MSGRIPEIMKAAILHAPLDLRYETVPVPAFSDGEILIRVRAALTCGTDQKAYLRGHPKIRIPGALGHEFSGEVAAAGRAVQNVRVGDRVACVHTAPCGECFFCGKRQPNLCETLTDRMAYGAYAEYIRIPEHVHRQNCLPLPPGLTHEAAALTEPLACCVYGMKQVNVREGETVLILGDGPVALMMVALARLRGAHSVAVAGRHKARLDVAAAAGAQRVFGEQSAASEILDFFRPRGPDVVLECVGNPDTWRLALSLVRPGGRILLFGGCPPGVEVPIDAGKIHYGHLAIYGTFHFTPVEVREALNLLESGSIPVYPLITARVPLSDIPRYFSADAPKDYLKVAFIP